MGDAMTCRKVPSVGGEFRFISIILLVFVLGWISFPLDPISGFELFNTITQSTITRGSPGRSHHATPYPTQHHYGSIEAGKWNSLIERCKRLDAVPLNVNDSNISAWLASAKHRGHSDRYEHSPSKNRRDRVTAERKRAPVTILRNATLWTGRLDGKEVIRGDVILGEGVVKDIASDDGRLFEIAGQEGFEEIDVNGAWVTPGLVDLHSHIGVHRLPHLGDSSDSNSHFGPILPYLRSIDGLSTHDLSYELSIAGGVTTAQVLPGSANNIGGQAYVIKLRKTREGSAISKVVEPPDALVHAIDGEVRWRHMKHACGENPDRRYSQTRMDAAWQFRNAYNEAKKIKNMQDEFCKQVLSSSNGYSPAPGGEFPESPLESEALVDVLRGRVKLSIHCYEAVDLDMIVRLSNEFKFPIASLHHAGETYLVPEVLKRAWGGTPAVALFAANARKKREAYRNSEFAPKILADNGVSVVMKSDHPVLNSRHLVYEAQQAHYYGLDSIKALQSVTSAPAMAAGLAHRIGYVSEGYDADLVVWDSHPLTLGATPRQVFIDGIPQLEDPYIINKPSALQAEPVTPDFSKEAKDAVRFDGLPPLEPKRTINGKNIAVLFTNVDSVYVRDGDRVETLLPSVDEGNGTTVHRMAVLVRNGNVECYQKTTDGGEGACTSYLEGLLDLKVIDLEGGSLIPGLTTFGTSIGLQEIALEPSANDGDIIDPFSNYEGTFFRSQADATLNAKDGLQFGGRNTLLAYRGGVTQAIVAPSRSKYVFGFAAAFSTGARNALEQGAIIQSPTALHVSLNMHQPASVSTQIAELRYHLLHARPHNGNDRPFMSSIVNSRQGPPRTVFHVDSADIMATLIALKREYHEVSGETLPVTFVGAAEAHILSDDIARENISVILAPSRPFPNFWDQRRILPGPPLSAESQISYLMKKGVNVALGAIDEFDARNARFDAGWTALASGEYLNEAQALELITANLEKALGVTEVNTDIVAFKGGSALSFESKVAVITSKRRGVIELLEP